MDQTQPPPQVEQTEREAFEVWATGLQPPYKLERAHGPWAYFWNSTACAWAAWRAGRASRDPEVSALQREVEELRALTANLRSGLDDVSKIAGIYITAIDAAMASKAEVPNG